MTADFNTWWDSDFPREGNPYRRDSPAYWAWLGWQAGKRHEREQCAKVCQRVWDSYIESYQKHGYGDDPSHEEYMAAIRAIGEA